MKIKGMGILSFAIILGVIYFLNASSSNNYENLISKLDLVNIDEYPYAVINTSNNTIETIDRNNELIADQIETAYKYLLEKKYRQNDFTFTNSMKKNYVYDDHIFPTKVDIFSVIADTRRNAKITAIVQYQISNERKEDDPYKNELILSIYIISKNSEFLLFDPSSDEISNRTVVPF